MRQSRDWSGLFLLLFFISGGSALVYEVVWSKYLSQMFGSTVQAQTVVLAVFMGGLALGNRLAGSWADTAKDPIKLYGYMEMAIGIYAFLFPVLFALADKTFVSAGSKLLDSPRSLVLLKGGLSLLLLLGPTVLMGSTLPLMSAWLNRHSREAGRRSARFYSVNSLGAVLGAGLAGFYLIKSLGLVATLQVTALVNVLLGGTAILLSGASQTPAPPVDSTEVRSRSGFTPTSMGWAGLLVLTTGGVSMGLEVLASRSLALILGSSLQSFAVVLMAFILGIGLGSAGMASRNVSRCQSEKAIVWLLAGASAWISLLVLNLESWVEIYRVALTGLARTLMGYAFHELLAGAMAMVVLGIPAAMIGAVLPLLIRSVSGTAANLGERVGRLLTWNTVGAVGGVLLTGFVLMPRFGLRPSFAILALGLVLVAGIAAWKSGFYGGLIPSGGAALLGAALLVFDGEGWRHVLSSGVFRSRETTVDFTVMEKRKQHVAIAFYEDAPDATVSVEHGDGVGAPAEWGLRINGKADASSHGDLGTQLLVGHLPILARPESKDIFILGLGSGITGGAVLCHPVDSLTIAENCEPVVRASQWFETWNRGVLTNKATKLWLEDARTVLKLSRKTYDVIITQPSNPWMAGIGSVFSREYYLLAASRLKPGGIMAQWFHVYEMHDGIVELVLRTFSSVFPHMEIWDTGQGDIVLLGSLQRWETSLDRFQPVFERAAFKADLARLGLDTPEALLARQLASQSTAFAIVGEGPIQSDAFPILEYEAPRAFFMGISSHVLQAYDERTRQWENCPAFKRAALQSLSLEDLRKQFTRLSTINQELDMIMTRRFQGEPPLPNVPCLFTPADQTQEIVRIPENVSTELKDLLTACVWMQTNRKREGADKIAALLERRGPTSDWAPAHYAALAVKASLAEANHLQAQRILNLGLKLDPSDAQLHYLSRIVYRSEPRP